MPSDNDPYCGLSPNGTVGSCSAHVSRAGRTKLRSSTYSLCASMRAVDPSRAAFKFAAHASRRGPAAAINRDPMTGARPTSVVLDTASACSLMETSARARRLSRASTSQDQDTPATDEAGGYMPVRRLLKSFAASKATRSPRAHVSKATTRLSNFLPFESFSSRMALTAGNNSLASLERLKNTSTSDLSSKASSFSLIAAPAWLAISSSILLISSSTVFCKPRSCKRAAIISPCISISERSSGSISFQTPLSVKNSKKRR